MLTLAASCQRLHKVKTIIIQMHVAANGQGDNVPLIAVKTSSKIESHRNQPRISMHSNER